MKPYIKLPKIESLPDSSILKRKLNSEIWKNYIFSVLLEYYKFVDNKEIISIIENESQKQRSEIEKIIKEHISKWLKYRCRKFDNAGLIINLEPSTECKVSGFYDLKFEHSDWRNQYFSFEVKNLGKAKSITLSKSINEYVYVKEKDREDGGMYRYLNGKYACNMNFGGMIGFVIGRTENSIIEKLINKIYTVYDNNTIGMLTNDKIIKNSIYRNPNTFDSIHIRKNSKTKENEEFRLHHIIMDFVNSEN